tara:strand:- start:522 stop:3716 length:3195 start_codon:yes stop_codon:yes gene_type:complete
MNLKLVVISEAKCDSIELLLNNSSHGVGRRHDNELRIQENCVSGYHAELNRTPDGDYEVNDLDSSNGTFLNEERISSPEKIEAGDFLKFGNLKVAVEIHNGEVPLQKNRLNPEKAPIKIVSLKDRFAFAKQGNENNSPVLTERKTNGISKKTATTEALNSEPDTNEENKEIEQAIAELRKKLSKKGHENSELSLRIKSAENTESSLNSKIESLKSALSDRESEIDKLKRTTDRDKNDPQDLSSIKSEFKDAKNTLTNREKELALLREELNRSKSELETVRTKSGSGQDNIVLFDSEAPPIEGQSEAYRTQLNELTASRDAAEEEARRLREELSRAREKPSGNESDNEKRLSFHITELESSLSAERLLHDDVRLKNEQFRSKIQFLSSDKDNALEEISRLKATNARQFTTPNDLDGQTAEAAKLRQEIAISHEDNADLRAETISLKSQLADHERELDEKNQDDARVESNTISQLRKQITELNSKIAETKSASENFEKNRTDLTQSQDDLQRQLETADEAVQKSTEREGKLRQNNAKLVIKVKEAERKTSELATQIKERASATANDDKLIKNLENQLKESESKTSKLAGQIEETKSATPKNEKLIKKLKKQLEESESHSETQQTLKDELDSTEQMRVAAEAEINQLKETLASMEAGTQSVKEQLVASEEHCSELASSLSAESELASDRTATIDQLRAELNQATQDIETSEKEFFEKHRKDEEALDKELQSSLTKSEQLKMELESVHSKLSTSQEQNAREQTQIDSEHLARLAELEAELAQSMKRCDEIQSAQEGLRQSLNERDEQIIALKTSSEDLELKFEVANEEKGQLHSDLQLTREGLSGALHSTQRRLAEANKDIETEILRRDKVEKQLRKATAALGDLRDEAAALRTESDEGLALSSGDTDLNRISDLMEENSDEQDAFEARLEALSPNKKNGNGSAGNGSFSEEEFYRQLVTKLDLVDDLMKRYENKWRYTKIIQQLALLKNAFLELLEDHSVSQFQLKPGTPMCLNQSNRIDLAPLKDGTLPKLKPFGKSEVIETVCPGYLFNDGSRDIIIRKAKVLVN